MNHWDFSPVGSMNEVARKKGTPTQDDGLGGTPSSNYHNQSHADKYKYLLGTEERLEKLRRSSHHRHSSHHHTQNNNNRRDAMDDDERNDIIGGLLYPGLEEEDDGDCDFFEEDYEMAQAAVASSSSSSTTRNNGSMPSSYTSDPYNMDTNMTSIAPNSMSRSTTSSGDAFDTSAMLTRIEREYERSYFASMGRPYSDLSNEKLGRY